MARTPIVNIYRAALGPDSPRPHPGGGPGGLGGLKPPKPPATIPNVFGRGGKFSPNAAQVLLAVLAHPVFRAAMGVR